VHCGQTTGAMGQRSGRAVHEGLSAAEEAEEARQLERENNNSNNDRPALAISRSKVALFSVGPNLVANTRRWAAAAASWLHCGPMQPTGRPGLRGGAPSGLELLLRARSGQDGGDSISARRALARVGRTQLRAASFSPNRHRLGRLANESRPLLRRPDGTLVGLVLQSLALAIWGWPAGVGARGCVCPMGELNLGAFRAGAHSLQGEHSLHGAQTAQRTICSARRLLSEPTAYSC